jgi:hypothetical protein
MAVPAPDFDGNKDEGGDDKATPAAGCDGNEDEDGDDNFVL